MEHLILICVVLLLKSQPSNCNVTASTKEELIERADILLSKFYAHRPVDFGDPCPNPARHSIFSTYVHRIHKQLEELNYAPVDSEEALLKMRMLLITWESVDGWRCDPSYLECKHSPPEHPHIGIYVQAIRYKCACASTYIPSRNATLTSSAYPLSVDSQDDFGCRYDKRRAYCSFETWQIQCRELDHVCLLDEFNIRCNPKNFVKLQEYLNKTGLPLQDDICKCRPQSEEVVDLSNPLEETRTDILLDFGGKPKPFRQHGETCVDVEILIQAMLEAHPLPPGKYTPSRELLNDFKMKKEDPAVAVCDEEKELFCNLNAMPEEGFGKCECKPVPHKTAWFKHPVHEVTPDGFCALGSDSDCATGFLNSFTCYPEEKCVVQLSDVKCTPENVEEGRQLRFQQLGITVENGREMYLERCHCKRVKKILKTFNDTDKSGATRWVDESQAFIYRGFSWMWWSLIYTCAVANGALDHI